MQKNRNPEPRKPLFDRSRCLLAGRILMLSLAACAPTLITRVSDAPGAARPHRPAAAPRGDFDRKQYDLYASVDSHAFDRVLGSIAGATMSVGGDRPIDIRMKPIGDAFRPGYPEVMVPATARDRTTGAEADVMVEAKLMIESDPAKGGKLSVKPVPLKLIPQRNWGLHDLAQWEFSQRLRAINAADINDSGAARPIPETLGQDDLPADGQRGLFNSGSGSFAASGPIAGGLSLV